MRILFLIAVVFLGPAIGASGQSEAQREGNHYIDLSRQLNGKGEKDKARELVQRAIDVFSAAKLYTDLGFAYWELSGYYGLSGDQASTKIGYIQRAVNVWHQGGNVKKEADGLKELADARQINGDFPQALTELKQALKLYQSINEADLRGVYDLLGDVSTSLGNLNDAVQYGLLAVQAAEKMKDTGSQLTTIYNHLGVSYYYLKDFPAAATYYAKALASAERNKAKSDIYIISYNYGNILKKMERYADCNRHLSRILKEYPGVDTPTLIHYTASFLTNYTSLKDFAQAGRYFEQLNRLIKGRSLNNETQRGVYLNSILYLIGSGRYNEARGYLQEAEVFLSKNGTLITLSTIQQFWSRLDSATGDFHGAYTHLSKYTLLKDSILSQEKNRAIAGLSIQYETRKKDQDLLLKEKDIELLKQQAALQQADLAQSHQTRNGALGAGVLLLAIVALLVHNSRVKQRANRLLRGQQKEIEKKNVSLERLVEEKDWLVREIHHRVKNNFHMVIALLGTQSEYLRTEEAIRAFTDSRNRVQAMSLVHQKLYQSENLSEIDMADFIRELVQHLRTSLDIRPAVQFRFDLESIALDLNYAIPLGLIVNEAVTNSVKYAFHGTGLGTIGIAFKRLHKNLLELRITDNGIGLPAGFDTRSFDSMGLKLIKGLSDDVEARLEMIGSPGTQIFLQFKYDTAI